MPSESGAGAGELSANRGCRTPRANRGAPFRVIGLMVAAVYGCATSAADHEVLGDRAYADARFDDALVEYRLALLGDTADPDVRRKAGAAALRAGQLHAAVEEYLALARDGDPETVAEAADGLDRVARTAVQRSNQSALTAALNALERVAPERASGEFALQLARDLGGGSPGEMLAILLHAAAAAPDARLQDSLMFSYAEALRRQQRCAEAIPILEGLLRRQREPRILPEARRELAQCALLLGGRMGTRTELELVARAGTEVPLAVLHRT